MCYITPLFHPSMEISFCQRFMLGTVCSIFVLCSSFACQYFSARHLLEGNIAAHEGRFEDARRFFELGVQANQKSARPYALLGNVYYRLGNVKEARKAWMESLERDNTNAHARIGLAQLALGAHNTEAALAQLQHVEGSLKDHEGATLSIIFNTMKSLAHLARGAPDDAQIALVSIDAVLEQSADLPQALYIRSNALLALGRYADARKTLERLKNHSPQSPLGPYGLARLAAARSEINNALLHLQAAKTLAGSSWKPNLVAADAAFAFLLHSEDFLTLVDR